MKTTDAVDALLRDKVLELGFELDDVEFVKEQGNWILTLYIDAPGGVTIDDCETVSRAVDPILDEADPIEQSYYLSVSSIGLDRPLKKSKDFARNLEKTVTVKLYAPQNGKKEFCGTLKAFDEENFTIEEKGAELTIKRKDAAIIKPYVSFE